MDPTDYGSVLEDDLPDLLITMSMLSIANNGTLGMDTMPGGIPNQGNPGGGMIGNNEGNVTVGVGGVSIGQMGQGGVNAVMGNNMPMDQWGSGNRFQTNVNPGMLQPNQTQNMIGMVGAGGSNQMFGGPVGNMGGNAGGAGVGGMNSPVGGMGGMVAGGQVGVPGSGIRPQGGQHNVTVDCCQTLNAAQLALIMQKIKSNPSSPDCQQILQVLKRNPRMMAQIIKQRQQRQLNANGSGGGGQAGNGHS